MFRSVLTGLALAALAVGAPACSSDSTSSATTAATSAASAADSAASHSGAHLYQCPMHPEVTSDKPGTCPKCGMTLEHTDNAAGSGRTFEMQLTATPATISAGQPVKLAFRPLDKAAPDAPVPLAVVHDKKIHLIIVSKDLKEFYHEHPEFGADGKYTASFTFPHGGEYVLFQDYTPDGDHHQLGRQDITVAGQKRAPQTFGADQLTWAANTNGYSAALAFDKPVTVNTPLKLQATLTHRGKPITDLAPYLGAMGHMVILSEDTKEYLHVHPQESAATGPTVDFQTQFDKPGRYRVFLQFNHGGAIQTADFVVNVAPAAGATAQAAYECPMQCEGSASAKPGKCPVCGMELVKKS